MRHVAEAAYNLLLRRWQMLLLLLLLLSPRQMPIMQQLQFLAHPVLAITEPNSPWVSLASWIVIVALAQAWTKVQGDVLGGGPAWAYARSLPQTARLARLIDIAVLTVSDLPLLLPFIAALSVLPDGPLSDRLLQGLAVVVAAAQLPLMQWVSARRVALLWLPLAAQLSGLVALALGFTPIPFLLLSAMACIHALRRAAAPVKRGSASRAAPRRRPWRLPDRAPVSVRLALFDLRGLLSERGVAQHFSICALLALPLPLLAYLQAYQVRPEVATGVIVLLVIPLVFVISGLAFELRRMHAPALSLYASLGVPLRTIRCVDLAVLSALYLLACSPLAAAAIHSYGGADALILLPLSLAALIVSVLLNFRGDHGVTLLKVLICVTVVSTTLILLRP
ncbi:MAG TPA: hypothetical protein VES41_15945 [Variovorax sp.]|nr:hypothetical protein [Variovorax sp.]